MVDMVGTAFSYGRALIVCQFLQESSKVKESSFHEIWNADTAFLPGGAEAVWRTAVPLITCIQQHRHIVMWLKDYTVGHVISFAVHSDEYGMT